MSLADCPDTPTLRKQHRPVYARRSAAAPNPQTTEEAEALHQLVLINCDVSTTHFSHTMLKLSMQ